MSDLQALQYRIHELEGDVSKLNDENEQQAAKITALTQENLAIRRLFCASVTVSPFTDDGEASDREIDYLRDSPEEIQRKRYARAVKTLQDRPEDVTL